jgi:hypothetical protein
LLRPLSLPCILAKLKAMGFEVSEIPTREKWQL